MVLLLCQCTKVAPQHKKLLSGTKLNTLAHKIVLRQKMLQNAMEECIMPQQKKQDAIHRNDGHTAEATKATKVNC